MPISLGLAKMSRKTQKKIKWTTKLKLVGFRGVGFRLSVGLSIFTEDKPAKHVELAEGTQKR